MFKPYEFYEAARMAQMCGEGTTEFNQFDYLAGLPSIFEMEISDGWKFDIVTESQGKLSTHDTNVTSISSDPVSCIISERKYPIHMFSRWYLNGEIKFIYEILLSRPFDSASIYEYDVPENGPMGSPARVDVSNGFVVDFSLAKSYKTWKFEPAVMIIKITMNRRKIDLSTGRLIDSYSIENNFSVNSGSYIIVKSNNLDTSDYSNMVYATWHYSDEHYSS